MTERDQEIDEVLRGLRSKPYIEQPDELGMGEHGACFADQARMCNASCTAFVDPNGPTALDRCFLLQSFSRGLDLIEELVQIARPRKVSPVPDIVPPFDPLQKRGGG